MLKAKEKKRILEEAKKWFKEVIIKNHEKNVKKLKNPSEFNINPFLVQYLATFLDGEVTEQSIAKALIYPRALSSAITTSFGTNFQLFVVKVLGDEFASTTQGCDLEFKDQIDGHSEYSHQISHPFASKKATHSHTKKPPMKVAL